MTANHRFSRMEAEEKIRLLAHALESTPELISITDLKGRFTYVNKAFLEAYGYSEKEVLGRNPDILRSRKVRQALVKQIWEHTRRGGWVGEVLNRRKDGAEFTIALSTSQVKDGKGRVVGLIGVARDISALKRGEETLRKSEARFRNLFEADSRKSRSRLPAGHPGRNTPVPAISDFAERVDTISEQMTNRLRQVLSFASLTSHELRTPLSIVRSQLEEVLRPKAPATEMRRTLTSVYDEILRMDRIVDNLLSLATLQAGKFQLDLTRFSLNIFLKDFCEEASILAREKNITVILTKAPEQYIHADRVRLQQVLFALFDNALKHTLRKGRIRVGLVLGRNQVSISMTDNGKGIPAGMIERIFDPFYRADSVHTRGTGLGLALVKWVVEAHGGTISVRSRVGKGSVFTIRLPIRNSLSKRN